MAMPPPRHLTIVTGASLGIGRAIAARFLAAGHHVLLVARDSSRLETAAAALRASAPAGAEVLTLALDITGPDCIAMLEALLEAGGFTPRVLVNNAGIGLGGAFVTQPRADIDRLIAVDISALTRLTRHFAERFARLGAGSIINIASLGGYVPGPNQAAYYASKAYVLSLSEALASELAASGVHVMAVAPGPVRTRIHATMRAERSLYRVLLPAMSPEAIASSTYWGWRLGRRVVVPGLHYHLLGLALRALPHRLTVPVVGALLKPMD